MHETQSTYAKQFFADIKAKRRSKEIRSKISIIIEWTAIIALCAGMGYWFAIAI